MGTEQKGKGTKNKGGWGDLIVFIAMLSAIAYCIYVFIRCVAQW